MFIKSHNPKIRRKFITCYLLSSNPIYTAHDINKENFMKLQKQKNYDATLAGYSPIALYEIVLKELRIISTYKH